MEINYVKKTHITGKLLKEHMPEDLVYRDIVLNLGNGHLNINNYEIGSLILNPPEAVRNSANKKIMFELFKQNDIRCIEYIDNKDMFKFSNIVKARTGQLFIRKGYSTVREDKEKEYRIIVFRDRILKKYLKVPIDNEFILKRNNTVFQRRRIPFHQRVNEKIIT